MPGWDVEAEEEGGVFGARAGECDVKLLCRNPEADAVSSTIYHPEYAV